MPEKYVIHTTPVPNRFRPLAKSGIIAWEEGCLRCAVCVKQRCIYDVYNKRDLDTRHMIDSTDNLCLNCLRCVQGCPKGLIHKSLNPEFRAMGDSFFTPDIIARLWYQAETGKIPVSGAGYPGPFTGPGFDSMWTDMSEIVRPTRDGIHGREYISTAVDLGGTSDHLKFDDSGHIDETTSRLVEIPLPIILRLPPFGFISEKTVLGWALAARRLGTLLSLPQEDVSTLPDEFNPCLIPQFGTQAFDPGRIPAAVRIVELSWTEEWKEIIAILKGFSSPPLVSVKIAMERGMEKKAVALAKEGVDIIHLEGESNLEASSDNLKERSYDIFHVKDGIRSVHSSLVEAAIRDEVTLLAGGGIAMAEHVAKAILCGADAVLVDFPLLIALQCRMCRRCTRGLSCPVEVGEASSRWVAGRMVNLIGAWHNQLLEVMGAMGIRDARRMRGEVGRAMFYDYLDEATFGSMGSVEEGCEVEW